jgi:hypothetical protein
MSDVEWAWWWQARCRARTALGSRCGLRRNHDADHRLDSDFGCMTWSTKWTGRLSVPPVFKAAR